MKALKSLGRRHVETLKKNTQKKKWCFERSALTEGVLGFHHILLRAGAATTELSGLNSPPIFLPTA